MVLTIPFVNFAPTYDGRSISFLPYKHAANRKQIP